MEPLFDPLRQSYGLELDRRDAESVVPEAHLQNSARPLAQARPQRRPFWKRPSFIILAVLLGVGLIVGGAVGGTEAERRTSTASSRYVTQCSCCTTTFAICTKSYCSPLRKTKSKLDD